MSLLGEGAKATGTYFDIMRAQPLALSLVVMNIALLFVFWMILSTVAEQRKREVQALYDEGVTVRQMLHEEHQASIELLIKCGVIKQNQSLLRLPPLPVPLPDWIPVRN